MVIVWFFPGIDFRNYFFKNACLDRLMNNC
jgi:hypothetical protein